MSDYESSVKKAQEANSDYSKCRACKRMTSKCPMKECFKEKKKK